MRRVYKDFSNYGDIQLLGTDVDARKHRVQVGVKPYQSVLKKMNIEFF